MKISELTMRTGKLNQSSSQKYVDDNISKWFIDGELKGNIDAKYDIRQLENTYSLWDKDNYVASAQLNGPDENGYSEVNLIHVDKKYRGQRVLDRLLWNFKSRQGHSKLKLNQYHSDDLYDIIKGNGLSRFKRYWANDSGQTMPYDPSTVDQYYSFASPTGWYLVLENTGNFQDMPQYSPGTNWITEDYDWQIR